jgi:transcriptional regulator with XRE-family HTH domain
MLGIEYVLNLYGIQHQELAEKLGIKKQNINLWIKGKQNVSKKYLPILAEMFGIDEEYFQKELAEIDKLIIQKEKLKKELKPVIVGYETKYEKDKQDLVEVPVYNVDKEIKQVDLEIEKMKVSEGIKEIINKCATTDDLDKFELFLRLLKSPNTNIKFVEYTIETLCHHYDVLPEWVTISDTDGVYYMNDLSELIAQHENEGFKSPKPN